MIFPWNPPFLPGFSMAMLNNQMVLLLCAQACPLRTASFLSKDGPSHYSTSPICQSELLEFGKLLPQASTKTGTPLDERNIEKPIPAPKQKLSVRSRKDAHSAGFPLLLGFLGKHPQSWLANNVAGKMPLTWTVTKCTSKYCCKPLSVDSPLLLILSQMKFHQPSSSDFCHSVLQCCQ